MTGFGFNALVALDDLTEILPSPLRRAFATLAPRSSLRLSDVSDPAAEQAMIADVDNCRFAVALFDGQVPSSEFNAALRRSILWPDAADTMNTHNAFLAVGTVERQTRHGLARAQATALTRLLAGIAEAMPASGILWHSSEVCASAERVARAPSEMNRGKWPVDFWIGYQHYGDNDPDRPVVGLQTKGAADYLGFEIEIPPYEIENLHEPLRILYNATGYLMNYGDVIRNGQLVEVEGERRTSYQLHLGADGQPGLARLTMLDMDHRQMV